MRCRPRRRLWESSSSGPFLAFCECPARGSSFSRGLCLITNFYSLYGLSAHQTYRYARVFPSDSRFIKMLVRSVWFLPSQTSC